MGWSPIDESNHSKESNFTAPWANPFSFIKKGGGNGLARLTTEQSQGKAPP